MSEQQYRTLGEGDRRLPGYECRLRYVPHAQWVPSGAAGIIDADDIRRAEYRVPCSATVAPDGYEVVERGRLPREAKGGDEWLMWNRGGNAWMPLDHASIKGFVPLAAPADELAALYAAGDAEREQPATAPASPCPCCAERDEARAEVAEVRRAWDATVEARDDARAEVERLRAQIAAARAALEGRDG